MTMKKTTMMMMAAVMCCAMLSSCILERRAPKGDEMTCNEQVGQFDKIRLWGNFKVEYTQSDTCTLEMKGYQRDIDGLTCEVHDGVLVVSQPGFRTNSKVKLILSSRMLQEVRVEGACKFDAERSIKVQRLAFKIEGAGSIDIDDLTCDTLQIGIEGAGEVDVNVRDAQQTKVTIDGAGDAELTLKDCGNVDCSIDGAGKIELKGNVHSLTKHVDGVGKIDTKELTFEM